MPDSPYPGKPDAPKPITALDRVLEDVAAIRRTADRLVDSAASTHRCVHRTEEALLSWMANDRPTSVPPMRPKLDTHRGLGGEPPPMVGAVAEAIEVSSLRRDQERNRLVIVGIVASVGGTLAWKLLEALFPVLRGHG